MPVVPSSTALDPSASPLGQRSTYITEYDPDLLFPIDRAGKRDEIGVPKNLPFSGFDVWYGYELSWLNMKGKPQVALARFDIDCQSQNIIESKSFKLYLNSYNNTRLSGLHELKERLKKDLAEALQGVVRVELFQLDDWLNHPITGLEGELLDNLDIACDCYQTNADLLQVNEQVEATEVLYSHLLKSNCLVTGQPDWGSVQISYTGPQIDKEGLLKYIVSFRNHHEFHEQCVERIFMDVQRQCKPRHLTVRACYTRRGGLDINPVRSTGKLPLEPNRRLARQ